MNKIQKALELRKALQLFLTTLDIETQEEEILSVASVFPTFKIGKMYKVKEIFSYGENASGDAQLYQVLQNHTSAEAWVPGEAPSLYKAIGVTEDGLPVWVQPLGASDAYMKSDKVMHNDKIWESLADNNVWEPGTVGTETLWIEVTE